MEMLIVGFSCEAEPEQNPGEKTGFCDEGYRFIYMTGSGAWSRLLKPGALDALIGEAESRVPMGYNQLWVFEKKFCAAPAPRKARRGRRMKEELREYPRGLERHLWPGRLYVVLQDPERARRGPVVLTYHTGLGEAVACARAQADELGVRTIVGLMLADVNWH